MFGHRNIINATSGGRFHRCCHSRHQCEQGMRQESVELPLHEPANSAQLAVMSTVAKESLAKLFYCSVDR